MLSTIELKLGPPNAEEGVIQPEERTRMIHIEFETKVVAEGTSKMLLYIEDVPNCVFATRDGSGKFLVLDEKGLEAAHKHGRKPLLVFNPERRASPRVNLHGQEIGVRIVEATQA